MDRAIFFWKIILELIIGYNDIVWGSKVDKSDLLPGKIIQNDYE